jgi:hypothetical protein
MPPVRGYEPCSPSEESQNLPSLRKFGKNMVIQLRLL